MQGVWSYHCTVTVPLRGQAAFFKDESDKCDDRFRVHLTQKCGFGIYKGRGLLMRDFILTRDNIRLEVMHLRRGVFHNWRSGVEFQTKIPK
jgi:hypothetical protein